MDESPGIELSLLEGMDETLLTQLHRLGIRTRAELEARISSRDGRRALSRELGATTRRLEVLYHLNFLLPEERVERTLEIERRLLDRSDHVDQEFRQVWRAITGVAVGVLTGILLSFLFLRPPGSTGDSEVELLHRVAAVEQTVAALRPMGIRYSEQQIFEGVTELGPAPGWNGPLTWSPDAHRRVQEILGTEGETLPSRAVSLALMRLAALENAPPESLSWEDRARTAAALVRDFPVIPAPATVWDRAAVLLRTRCRSRALGLAPLDSIPPDLSAAVAHDWTAPGFLTCEEMLARLEALPVRDGVEDLWSESLIRIRTAADAGRERLGQSPEAFARDYWIRRAELEYAVVAGILGKPNLLPYHRESPRIFLEQRLGFLESAKNTAPVQAKAALAWLAVDYEESARLLDWLKTRNPSGGDPSQNWVEALARIESERRASMPAPGPGVERRVREAAGPGTDPWSSPDTRRQAGLRPLFMETRGAMGSGSGVSAGARP